LALFLSPSSLIITVLTIIISVPLSLSLPSLSQLLDFIAPLQLGALASEEDKSTIEKLARQLERINPTKSPLLSPKLNGQWKLSYTTSESILGLSRPALFRPKNIFQTLDNENLKGRNDEGAPLFNAVKADLEPENDKKTQVQFTTFYILGFIPVTAPASARGELEITYLDDDLRISRGNKGNLFVLKMQDRNKRP
jgi:hypothetical protein